MMFSKCLPLLVQFLLVVGLHISQVSSFNVNTPHSLKSFPGAARSIYPIAQTQTTTSISTSALNASPVPIEEIFAWYRGSLDVHPIATSMVTGGILAFFGDFIAQKANASSPDDKYDPTRAASLVSFDVVYRASQCALFPEIVKLCDGRHLGSILPMADLSGDLHNLAVLEQTLTNQFAVIPFFYYPVFFTLTGFAQGLSAEASLERAQTTIVPLLKRNWLFWIPVQYFQFGYVEEQLQIPFLCVAGLAWTFILSATAGSAQTSQKELTTAAATPTIETASKPLVGTNVPTHIVQTAKNKSSAEEAAVEDRRLKL
eukprot:CAMPEP_0194086186 /NCGR_PEP_ID=MMETSP0149-20130528/20256_1 /TAXON_ID=122233 /ORGANISM="Chaetoceros debilis, Strain MM31A-1" /LENGTH=314 /DNA_ID=CAMNT_0038769223 /DNA_START=234 /DNA_END=1178 /DNA_ORIENTATION=+